MVQFWLKNSSFEVKLNWTEKLVNIDYTLFFLIKSFWRVRFQCFFSKKMFQKIWLQYFFLKKSFEWFNFNKFFFKKHLKKYKTVFYSLLDIKPNKIFDLLADLMTGCKFIASIIKFCSQTDFSKKINQLTNRLTDHI